MNRPEQERYAYDSALLQRSGYEKLFQRSSIDTHYLDAIIREQMSYAEDKVVLELGSNAWIGYLHLKHIRPKKLYCINISESELAIGIQYKNQNNISFPVEFALMDATSPAFDANQFDLIFGGAILHHLDLGTVMRNISSLTNPNGRILFHEPLGANPVAKIIRIFTPCARTRDERPLSTNDIAEINKYFTCNYYVSGGISTAISVVSNLLVGRSDTLADRWASRLDKKMSKRQTIRSFYREIIISGIKRHS
jgi:SAM-dependent methyltransferase